MPTMLARLCAAMLLLSFCSDAIALDPITLGVLRLLRDQVLSSTVEAGVASATTSAPPRSAPGISMGSVPTNEQLRGLVDEGFVYLTPAQRDELYASMQKLLADPRYASARPLIVEEFARKAAAARMAHERLSKLSPEEQKQVALRTVQEYQQMPPEEAAQMLTVLRARTAPIPRELNDLILAGLAEHSSGGTVAQ